MHSKLRKIPFSRTIIIVLLILLQLATLLVFVLRLSRYFAAMYAVLLLLSMAVALYVVNNDDNPSYKLAWIIPILLFPVFGGLLYLLFGKTLFKRKLYARISQTRQKDLDLLSDGAAPFERVRRMEPPALRQSQYLERLGYPAYDRTQTRYFPSGEQKFQAVCRALEEAKRYIFLEYFIIEEGMMWNTILGILERKAREGVEVRVIYDGFGCLMTLPEKYFKTLREKGIRCIEFNPLIPFVSTIMNHRDHRKILVVDGVVGYMGGVNLADEYINAVEKHGHWKDCAVELRGSAVWSLTVMFLNMWQGASGSQEDIGQYRPLPEAGIPEENGFVQPYSDNPLDHELTGEMVYLNVAGNATKYLYICTPYLIIDNETITALLLAAKSGVDVRIITPGHPDKWYVHVTSRAYYQQLLRGGVKIYEYEPGFIHCKTFLADDEVGTVGTVNLDYRSLYLHFECGVWMCHTSALAEMKRDFLETLERCTPITPDSPIFKAGLWKGLVRAVLRLLAPLM